MTAHPRVWLVVALALTAAGSPPTPHVEFVTNGSFRRGAHGWESIVSDPDNRVTIESLPEDRLNPMAHFVVRSVRGRPPAWHANLVQANQDLQRLKPATDYVLRFRARASSQRRLRAALAQVFETYRSLGLDAEVWLDPELREFTLRFRTDAALPAPGPRSSGAWLSFLADTLPGETWLDDISLVQQPTPLRLSPGRSTSVADFDPGEKWQGNLDVRPTSTPDGGLGVEVVVPANGSAFLTREAGFALPDTAWDLQLNLYCENPASVGRVSLMARSGEDRGLDDVIASTSGLVQGWNQLRFPRESFLRHWFSGFRWDLVRTLAVRIETNANGPARVLLGEIQVQPRDPRRPLPPVLRFVGVEDVGARSAFVVCETDVPVTARVLYGTSPEYGRTASSRGAARWHRIALEGLAPGTRHHVRVVLADGVTSSGDLAFRTPPEPPAGVPTHAEIPVVGLYGVAQLADLSRAAGSPFTVVQSYQFASRARNTNADARRYVARAESLGTRVIVGFQAGPIDRGDLDYVRERVRSLSGLDGVAGWYLYDEPELHAIEPAALRAAYRAIKAEDPRPVYIAASWLDADYPHRGAFDVAILDKYPVPWAPPDAIVPALEAAKRSGESFHFSFQAYAPDLDHRWPADGPGPGRFPSYDEMRAMAYLALNHGARGLWAFSYDFLHFTPGAAWKWIELTDLARELGSLGGVIGSTAAPGRQLAGAARDLDLAIRSWEGDDYVIAINRSPSAVSATVRLRGAAITSLTRVDHAPIHGPAQIAGHEFSDHWSGHGVHVYRIR